MVEIACSEIMQLLSLALSNPILMNHEREWFVGELKSNRDLGDLAVEVAAKGGHPGEGEVFGRVIGRWPAEHARFIRDTIAWALETLPIPAEMKLVLDGDATSEETITRVTLKEGELRLSFLHP